MNEKKQLTEEEYQKMKQLFFDSVTTDEKEKEKMELEIKKYGFIAFQEYYYMFSPLKQETKDNIYAVKTLVKEQIERSNENSRP